MAARGWRRDQRRTSEAANLPRIELGNISMATAVAFDVVVACATASCRPVLRSVRTGAKVLDRWFALAPKLLALSAMSCAMALAGCANNSAQQREGKADPIDSAAPVHGPSELRIHRPNRALLVPQPAPDCELKASDLKTVDADQWARLKLDYERQCYQRAEKMVRDRLRLLQASARCEIEPVRHSPSSGPVSIGPAASGGVHQRLQF